VCVCELGSELTVALIVHFQWKRLASSYVTERPWAVERVIVGVTNGRDGRQTYLDGIALEIAQFLGCRCRGDSEPQSPRYQERVWTCADLLNTPRMHKSLRSVSIG
jgi:hypothetical protein